MAGNGSGSRAGFFVHIFGTSSQEWRQGQAAVSEQSVFGLFFLFWFLLAKVTHEGAERGGLRLTQQLLLAGRKSCCFAKKTQSRRQRKEKEDDENIPPPSSFFISSLGFNGGERVNAAF